VNCSAIQETLLESELFGYEKGAFTGALKDKSGLIEVANTGTLFLDEIGELSPALQMKLLRFLEDGEYRPVGSTCSINADVRIICATNRDLKRLIGLSKFRKDLFYRINVINIALPPLRQRPSDIRQLTRYFMKKICFRTGKCVQKIDNRALNVLQQYHWPGNVRELENVLERAVILSKNDCISVEDLPGDLMFPTASYDEETCNNTISSVERQHIMKVLRDTGGNKTQAAKILGIAKKTLYARLHAYESE
jgi:transcriptional regulator with PAS, ATPase and Fis domain